MKVVFRTYTKRDGTPDYGYWAVLQHLEGLKEKDILVRIDIDKKQNLGYDEVDIFCPSLKISHLELKQLDDSKFEATFDTKNLRAVFQVLLNMGKAGNGGHCFEMLIGNKSFCIDGDGNDYLESINGVLLRNIKTENRHDWADIYNKDIENNTQDMKNNSIKLNETQMRGTVEKAVRQMLQEFQAGGNDWGQTYSEYKNRGFQTNRELDEVVQELHTICQYAEDLYNAAYRNQPSKYFQGCTQPYLKLAYEFVDPIYGLLANRTNLKNDAQAMTLEEIKEECMESLKHLSEMSRLGRVRDAAKRAYDLLNAEPATAVNEAQLRKIVAESVKKVLKEARMGRGTTTTTSSSWSGDEYGGTTSTFYRTEDNPYSNDAVMMLANRLEKRLGGDYRVEAHANPYRSEKYDYESDKTDYKPYLTKVDFVIFRKDGDSDYSIERQNIDDIVTISKVAKQLLSTMAEKVYISNVSCDGESELDSNDSVTITALLRNVDEPRKDMIPKSRWGSRKDMKFYEPTPDTGYADSKFTKPQSWHTTEN